MHLLPCSAVQERKDLRLNLQMTRLIAANKLQLKILGGVRSMSAVGDPVGQEVIKM